MDNKDVTTSKSSTAANEPPQSLSTPKGIAQVDFRPSPAGGFAMASKSPFRSPWSPSGTAGFKPSTEVQQLQRSGLYESLLLSATGSDSASADTVLNGHGGSGQEKSMELNLETALAESPNVSASEVAYSSFNGRSTTGSLWQATTPPERGASNFAVSWVMSSSDAYSSCGVSPPRPGESAAKFWGSPGAKPSRSYAQVPDTPLSSTGALYQSGKLPGGASAAVTLSPDARSKWVEYIAKYTVLAIQKCVLAGGPYDASRVGMASSTNTPQSLQADLLLPGSPPGWTVPDFIRDDSTQNNSSLMASTGLAEAAPQVVSHGVADSSWEGSTRPGMNVAMETLLQQAALLASAGGNVASAAAGGNSSQQQAMWALLLSSAALQMQLVASSGGLGQGQSSPTVMPSAQHSLSPPPPPPAFPPPGLLPTEGKVGVDSEGSPVEVWREASSKDEEENTWGVSESPVSEVEEKMSQIRVASDRDNAEASSIIKECGRRGDVRTCWKVWNHLITTGQCLSNWRGRGGEGRSKTSMDTSSPGSSPSSAPAMRSGSIFRPNEITLGCMTDALVSNRLVEEAEQLVGEWKELVPPNTVIYSTLIHGWAKQNDANRARSIFALMRDENVLCNAVTFNCLIHACVRVGDMQGALELLDAMKQQAANAGVMSSDGGQGEENAENATGGGAGGLLVPLPDKFTYSTIIKGYCARGEMEQSLQMFDTMLSDGLQPDLVIYNTLLDGCVKRRYHGTCERLLDDMTNYWKIQPNSYTLSILIKHYGRQGDLDRAFKLVEELPAKHGFEANAHVWTCLISACITHGEMETAQAIFDVMRKVKPSRRQEANGSSAGGFDAVNTSLATPTILRMAAKCAPDAKAYETQIHGWMKYNRQDRVKELTEDLVMARLVHEVEGTTITTEGHPDVVN
ncbi:hypothetical protein FOZ62_013464 [Perkinsus olseni]|uniref:Pentatricopeptide repeat-containing protein n=1 Tax=Perkinsus olseni TaxID=32597 RepID=A0A7J6PBX4_PEROL|nr:hypothetical protein FOZ62_013464 [Perkinsus olseni]